MSSITVPINICFITVVGALAIPALVNHFVPALQHAHPTFSQYGVPAIGLLVATLVCLGLRRAVYHALGQPV